MPAYKEQGKGHMVCVLLLRGLDGQESKEMKRGFPPSGRLWSGSGHSRNSRPPTWK